MKMTILSRELIDKFIVQGYTHLAGKTDSLTNPDSPDVLTRVIVTPVKVNLEKENLPDGYDNWYDLSDSDVYEMAVGVDVIAFYVNISLL